MEELQPANTFFTTEYYIAKMIYLQKELERLPKIILGKKDGKLSIRDYENSSSRRGFSEYYLDSPKAQSLIPAAKQTYRIKTKIKKLKKIVKGNINPSQYKLVPMVHNIFPISIKEKLHPCMNTMDNDFEYEYNKIPMRSRFETNVAKILDSLDLEFYYEPELYINGEKCYPDFVVFLPELGYCFIIECLGKTQDMNYLYNNSSKLRGYFNAGFEINKNLLLFSGTDRYLPPFEQLRAEIINLVNNVTAATFIQNIFDS